MKKRVYITDSDFPDVSIEQAVLSEEAVELIRLDCRDSVTLGEQAADAYGLIVQYASIPASLLDRMPDLQIIARYGAGYDAIDVAAATRRGVLCTHVPDYCLEEVSNYVLTAMLMLTRRIPFFIRRTREGLWSWDETGLPVHRTSHLTVGIIGFGRIARAVAVKVKALGCTVLVHTRTVDTSLEERYGISFVDRQRLLLRSDVLVILCPYTEETHHMIGPEELEMMGSDSVLINCARGSIVDQSALAHALTQHSIAAAALDVLEHEPSVSRTWDASQHPLLQLENCFITPHIAYYTEEALLEARQTAAEEIKRALSGMNPLHPIPGSTERSISCI
ncbi:MAG: C-terminal binding protein [Spirochaetia bacterium]|nr:C-terminal binding protein [Spirochaetia bacterium]MCF7940599.1 C-terminal binding protein [Spirochaetia bacterium]